MHVWNKLKRDFEEHLKTNHIRKAKRVELALKDYLKLMHKLDFVNVKHVLPVEEQLLTNLWNTLGENEEATVNA